MDKRFNISVVATSSYRVYFKYHTGSSMLNTGTVLHNCERSTKYMGIRQEVLCFLYIQIPT